MTEPLDPQRWARVEALFNEALDRPPAERAAFLAETCPDDEPVRREVESLLVAEGSGLTDRLGAVNRVADELVAASDSAVGRRLGPYRLEEEIGRGGMGVVYRAVRDRDDFQQTVAVKVLPGGLFSPDAVSRFRNERRILASLQHPSIARLLDGGTTPEGVPYVVMEYIDGVPVDRYAREQELDLEARIRLFLRLCDAVQYAHRNLVVHRDLKPDNILVTPEGVPKLLDFGIARLLDADDARAPLTRTRIMTPRFASPEQLRGERIGTPSDVYSLGRVLFRLLTDRDPHRAPAEDSGPSGVAELIREVLDREPPAPSAVAADRRLKGDLDVIVLKALRRDVDARYDSVRALVEDLERYLAGLPIAARPPTLRYRAAKYLRRNAVPVAAAALLVASLVGGLGAALWQGQRAERARQQAERARQQAETALFRSETVTRFLTGLFEAADPRTAGGEDVTAVQLVDRGVERIDELEDDPALQAQLLRTLAIVNVQLGRYDRAGQLAERAAGIRRGLEPDSALIAALNTWGQTLNQLGRPDSAAIVYREALDHSLALLGEEHDESLALMNNLAIVYGRTGRDAEAETLLRRLIETERRVFDPDDPIRTYALNNLGLQLTRGEAVAAARAPRARSSSLGRALSSRP